MLRETIMHKLFYPDYSLMVEDILSVTKHTIISFSLLISNPFDNLFIIKPYLCWSICHTSRWYELLI